MKNKRLYLLPVLLLFAMSILTPALAAPKAQDTDTPTPTATDTPTPTSTPTITPTTEPASVLISPIGTVTTWNNIFHWTGRSVNTWYQVVVADESENIIVGTWLNVASFECGPNNDCYYSPPETENLEDGNYKWRIIDYDTDYFSFGTYQNFTIAQTPTNTPTPTETFTPSPTPTETITPTPTDTPTPFPPITPAVTIVPEITYGEYAVTLTTAALCLVIIVIFLVAIGLYTSQRTRSKL